ncbi:hypothetical protein K2X33_06545 [bacterium]|nr:hypothetical protein [bacterium]
MSRLLLALFFPALMVCQPAIAGTVLTGTISDNGVVLKMKHYYQGDSFRMENRHAGAAQDDHWAVYRGKTQDILLASPSKKSYLEIKQADLERLSAILGSFAKKPAQPAADSGPVTFKALPGVQTVGKWQCTRYNVLSAGKTIGTLCSVPYATVGADPKDFHSLVLAGKSIQALSKLGQVRIPVNTDSLDKALELGFPVEFVGLDGDKPRSTVTIDTVVQEKVSEKLFAAPTGFQRSDLTALLTQALAKQKK